MITVSYDEAFEIALCYGWVDSQKEKLDGKMWVQRFTPLSGFKAIEVAKKNGQWDKAYESQSIASMPEDFAIELERNVKAKAFYDTLNNQNRYAILFRIHNAKKQETRAKRIQQFVTILEKGEKIYP